MSSKIGWLNAMPPDQAEAELLTCCASKRWARKVATGRPYVDGATLIAAAVSGVRELGWPDVAKALDGHPRIGERGKAGLSQRETSWSRDEQSGAATADTAVLDALHDGNVAYENQFGHVFLIRATGRTAEEMLAELTRRLSNSVEDERIVVQAELAEITRLRVRKLLEDR
ncbi:2-oxo-4-hydroxy-4-carboxy-5-ureidoimidazoline decarboxylase [Nocardia sp. NPDC052566]|uniref:2-oxo-4-hydroxy-4-carboxy-5-ureidoimidazoline decarboxylase n=1 Tax=Nocardia sp. NPDC052566 TaxID=3364330 RepID=UPI0037CAF4EB